MDIAKRARMIDVPLIAGASSEDRLTGRGHLCNIVIFDWKLRSARRVVAMPHSISLDQLSNESLLRGPPLLVPKLDALRGEDFVRQLGERETSRQTEESIATAASGRRKIWDFATNLHCSIIGTCLSTAELRHILIKLGRQEAATASEHDLHASGVVLCQEGARAPCCTRDEGG